MGAWGALGAVGAVGAWVRGCVGMIETGESVLTHQSHPATVVLTKGAIIP